jgi:hypothetical protein
MSANGALDIDKILLKEMKKMNPKDNHENNNESIIEDLSLPQTEMIKGGPTRPAGGGGGGNFPPIFDIVDS